MALQNVYLVPLTWDDEVMLLKRELARAHTSLKLEELRNEGLPQLVAASTPEEYLQRGNDAVTKLMQFVERKKMLPVKTNMDPALRAQIGEFVPEARRAISSPSRRISSHWRSSRTSITGGISRRCATSRTRVRSAAAPCSTTSG